MRLEKVGILNPAFVTAFSLMTALDVGDEPKTYSNVTNVSSGAQRLENSTNILILTREKYEFNDIKSFHYQAITCVDIFTRATISSGN